MNALQICRNWIQAALVLIGCLLVAGTVLFPVTYGYSLGLGTVTALCGAPLVVVWFVLGILTDKA